MEKKRVNLKAVAEETGKTAAGLFGKAKDVFVHAADQNDDGTFDLQDVSAIAGSVGNAVKSAASAAKAAAQEKSREMERKLLRPIFAEDIEDAGFVLSRLVRMTEIDKHRAESEACKGAIGFLSEQKDMEVVNIFRDKAEVFGLTFYPDLEEELYYVDPTDRNRYIALDEYFMYLREARVIELQRIAQDLGAKHFRVTYKEQKTTFSSRKIAGSAKIRKELELSAEQELACTAVSSMEIAAEMDCPGHAPREPKLCYLQRESCIQTLVDMRMKEEGAPTHQKYTLKLSNSLGIKEKDAFKIDAFLKGLKISGNTTLTSEVQNEARRFFEYEIDF